jgi:dihydrofolate synthase/folylpolyglutamate synthase
MLDADSPLDLWLDHIGRLHGAEIELGLDRLRDVAERLPGLSEFLSATGRAQRPQCVTVAGTNGKGSTVAMLEYVLQQSGVRTGSYTSPHLHRFNERLRIQSFDVADPVWCRAFADVERHRADVPLTYFEFTTLAALLILAGSGLDVVILEVGLGGRLDAVNIVDADIAIVSSIGLDHMDWLGDTLDRIGFEKAGIFRLRQRVLLGDAMPDSVLERAAALACRVLRVSADLQVTDNSLILEQRGASISVPNSGVGRLPLNNVLLSAQAFLSLMDLRGEDADRTRNALMHSLPAMIDLPVPGRLEPAGTRPPLWLDVGHNPHAAMYLASFLRRQAAPGQPCFAVYSALRDKDSAGVAEALQGVVTRWYIAALDVERRKPMSDLRQELNRYAENVLEFERLDAALSSALAAAVTERALVLVFGSFYVVEQAKQILEQLEHD